MYIGNILGIILNVHRLFREDSINGLSIFS